MTEETKKINGKKLIGTVVSDKMQKTAVVAVERYTKHPKYGKYMTSTKKYKAHNESDTFKTGDRVEIQEVRPISKDKSFTITKKIV
jgi:small subunit ribosomal protein S17